MAFEVYKRKSRAYVKDAVMAIQSRGTVSLNASAFRLLTGNDENAQEIQVELLYDPTEKVVGLRKVEKASANSYTVRKQKQAESYLLTGKSFFVYYGIQLQGVQRFNAHAIGDGIVGFSLEKDQRG